VNNKRSGSLDELRNSLRSLMPGTTVTLQIQREGRLMYVSFTLE
jgi:S1-C subfamily serine protease